jgi:ATP-dependent Clp endopeptidase proteolytic subunit ClpP
MAEKIDSTENRESLSKKEEAEARMLDAKAARYDAEAKGFQAGARFTTAEAERVEIKLTNERRDEEKKLLADEFYHLYQFNSSVSDSSVSSCMGQITRWVREANGEKIKVELVFHSPGGEVISGMALFDFIRHLMAEGHEINTVAIGMAASMAGILLQAGTKRIMGKQTWVMIHEASFAAMGSMGQVEDTVEWVKRVQKRILDIFAERSTMTAAQFGRRWKRKNWWLDSDECLKLGLVDEVR